MKLSKVQIKKHEEAEALLKRGNLTYGEKLSVYENWFPAYSNQIGKIASFFTPLGLAMDFSIEVSGGESVIDLCAGIGLLSFIPYHRDKDWEGKERRVVCVEQNPEFVRVGKILFPEAEWICGDVLDRSLIESLGKFDFAISNPPYGKIKTGENGKWLNYKGSEFEYKVIEIGSMVADWGAFIIPPMSAPFRYSGQPHYKEDKSDKYKKFHDQTGIDLGASCGIDTSVHKDEWKGTTITTEIVTCDFTMKPAKIVQQELFTTKDSEKAA